MICYKEIRRAAAVGEDTLDVSAPDALCIQNFLPAQPPAVEVGTVRSKKSMATLLKRLRGTRIRCDAGSSKD